MKYEAGKLENLNDLVIGAAVLCENKKYGTVDSISDIVTDTDGNIMRARITIHYPCAGFSFHSYRHDGRSREEAGYDITMVVKPDEFKVKEVKIFSDRPITIKEMEKANKALLMCKVAAEIGSTAINRREFDIDGIKIKLFLSKNFKLSLKVL